MLPYEAVGARQVSSCLSAPVSSSDEWGDTETPQLAAEAVSTRKMPVPSVPLTFPLRIGIPREFLSVWGEQVGMKGETGREDMKAHRPSFCLRVKLYACEVIGWKQSHNPCK